VTARRHPQHTAHQHPAHQHSAHQHPASAPRHFGTPALWHPALRHQHFSERSPPSRRLTQGLVLALVGALLGVALSAPVFLVISASMSGLGALSPWTMAGVCGVGWRRGGRLLGPRTATRISPTIALRRGLCL